MKVAHRSPSWAPTEILTDWKVAQAAAVKEAKALDRLKLGAICRDVTICRVVQGDATITRKQARQWAKDLSSSSGEKRPQTPTDISLEDFGAFSPHYSRRVRLAGSSAKFSMLICADAAQFEEAIARTAAAGSPLEIEADAADPLAGRLAVATSRRYLQDWLKLTDGQASDLAATLKAETPTGWRRESFPLAGTPRPVAGIVRIDATPDAIAAEIERLSGRRLAKPWKEAPHTITLMGTPTASDAAR